MKFFLAYAQKYAALIASVAALISATTTIIMYEYSKSINQSSISLEYTSGNKVIVSDELTNLTYFFILRLTGNESVNITNISTSYYNFKTNKFHYLDKNYSFLSTIHPTANFVHKAVIPISNRNNDNRKQYELAIMIRIDFKTTSGKYNVTYYLKHEPDFNSHYLSRSLYESMEKIPKEFRLNP